MDPVDAGIGINIAERLWIAGAIGQINMTSFNKNR
jgi:hypothetical protein